MKLTRLEIENAMRVKSFSYEPIGNMIVIGGENDQGKTAVLKCIEAFMGKKFMAEDMLREGAKKGHIEATTDGENPLRMRLDFAKGKPYKLQVFSEREGTGREVLDGVLSKFVFDLDAFDRMSDKEQVNVLRELDPTLDFSALDKERDDVFEKRKLVNRDIKTAAGAISELETYPDAPAALVSVADLMTELEGLEAEIDENEDVREDLRERERAYSTQLHFERNAKAELEEAERVLHDCQNAAKEYAELSKQALSSRDAAKEKVANIEDPDREPIREQIAKADEVNDQVRANEKNAGLESEHRALVSKSETMTARIAAIDEEKLDKVENSNLGIKDLGLDGNTIMFKGRPLSVACDSDQLRVIAHIGRKQNPELEVLLVRNGSKFDEKHLARFEKELEEEGWQAWVERASTGDECTFIMEDGMIKDATEETKEEENDGS